MLHFFNTSDYTLVLHRCMHSKCHYQNPQLSFRFFSQALLTTCNLLQGPYFVKSHGIAYLGIGYVQGSPPWRHCKGAWKAPLLSWVQRRHLDASFSSAYSSFKPLTNFWADFVFELYLKTGKAICFQISLLNCLFPLSLKVAWKISIFLL